MTVLAPSVVQKINEYLDEHHAHFADLDKQLFDIFGYDKDKNRISSQIRNLQKVACSALRFADVEDFVKNQMGKAGNRQWKQVGNSVLEQLGQLRDDSANLAEGVPGQMSVRLKLARGWVRAVVSEYLYRVALAQMETPK